MGTYDLSTIIALGVILLVAFPVHEFAHAAVAHRLGDDTAKDLGRLSLNPLRHLDVVGSLMLILTQFIGWAKPVPVIPANLSPGPRVGNAIVAGAGPLSNLAMAAVASVVFRLGLFGNSPGFVLGILYTFVAINVALFLFNMIPLGPLDGFSVLLGIVGEDLAMKLTPLRTYGSFILMGLLFIGFFSPNFNLISGVMRPLMNGIIGLLLGV